MSVREIVFDTETTGLNPLGGDRVVEIGCVELLNHVPTGATFHVYINPQRDMPAEAFAVHGLSAEFLSDKPVFEAIARDFVAFIGDARMVAHNASFDVNFLNAELGRLGHAPIGAERVVDTLALAKRKFPFAPATLDALCSRFGVDTSRRVKHGALLDAELLAEVYIELLGGRQADLGLVAAGVKVAVERAAVAARPLARPEPLPARLTAADIAAHEAFIATFKGDVVWRQYMPEPEAAREAS